MERNITIGLIIAFILTIIGAFYMSHSSDGGAGFLLDFLKNHTENASTNSTDVINTTINETAPINQTENITDNSTISFDASAVYDANNSVVLISVSASKENITADSITAFVSFDAINFTEAASLANVTLPTVVEISNITQNATVYYYIDIMYNGTAYRLPAEGAYNITT
ncbi:conserved hypothetical protein [Methanocaldococcus sp. FS406-22]|uniref:hypothetical protein n=1 Tax=Methanocaldococcus sp. (strain FS406-22) TaxID=644281 RepID=UPI0001BF34FA|nr:hypothetical protein [Methanocaldococcus sp. FS406-22]ADC69814.1 conserved hypothetical protein [Methanocaldococcus sp. FS406-22]